MNPQYYIAIQPTLSKEFYDKLNALYKLSCYPECKMPFHVTLFFLGEMDAVQKERVYSWMVSKKIDKPIVAKVKSIDYFGGDHPKVCYMELDSDDLRSINSELEIFSDIHMDTFSYVPHMSLFFPKKNISSDDRAAVAELFSSIVSLKFETIYLGSVENGGTCIHKTINT